MFTQKQREWLTGFLRHAAPGDDGADNESSGPSAAANPHAYHYAGAESEDEGDDDYEDAPAPNGVYDTTAVVGGAPVDHDVHADPDSEGHPDPLDVGAGNKTLIDDAYAAGAESIRNDPKADQGIEARPRRSAAATIALAEAAYPSDRDEDDAQPIDGETEGEEATSEPPKRKMVIDPRRKAKAHPTVDASDIGPAGMTGRRVSDSYDAEHNQIGWRAAKGPESVQKLTTLKTALYTEQQRQDNTLKMSEDGGFRTGKGEDVGESTMGYTMDPKTGEMVAFQDGASLLKHTSDGPETVAQAKNLGELVKRQKKEKDKSLVVEVRHHSTPLGGDVATDAEGNVRLDKDGKQIMKSRAAASAGFVSFDWDGKITEITNTSGHYKPKVSDLMQAVEFLTKQGAFLTDEITDADGRVLDENNKSFKLYTTVQAKLKQLGPLLAQAQDLTKALGQEGLPESDEAQHGKALESVSSQIAAIRKAVEKPLDVLRKLGVGPSQQTRHKAKVEFLDIKAGATGAEVYQTKSTKMGIDEFLQSGGGNVEQADAKSAMLEELQAATKKRRKEADSTATIGEAGPAPSKEDVASTLKTLRASDRAAPPPQPAADAAAGSRGAAPASAADLAAQYSDALDLEPEADKPPPRQAAGTTYDEVVDLKPRPEAAGRPGTQSGAAAVSGSGAAYDEVPELAPKPDPQARRRAAAVSGTTPAAGRGAMYDEAPELTPKPPVTPTAGRARKGPTIGLRKST